MRTACIILLLFLLITVVQDPRIALTNTLSIFAPSTIPSDHHEPSPHVDEAENIESVDWPPESSPTPPPPARFNVFATTIGRARAFVNTSRALAVEAGRRIAVIDASSFSAAVLWTGETVDFAMILETFLDSLLPPPPRSLLELRYGLVRVAFVPPAYAITRIFGDALTLRHLFSATSSALIGCRDPPELTIPLLLSFVDFVNQWGPHIHLLHTASSTLRLISCYALRSATSSLHKSFYAVSRTASSWRAVIMHDRNIRRVERVFPRRVLLEVERRFDYIPRTWIPRPSTRALRIQYGNALGAQYPQDPPLILPVGHPSYGKQVVVRDPEAQLPPWQVAALHQCTKALGDPCTLKVSCTVTWTSYTLYDRINAFFEFLEAVPWATLLHHWALACVSPHSSRHLRFSDPENAAFAACIVDAWLSAVGLHDL